jgi:hypothetical protein
VPALIPARPRGRLASAAAAVVAVGLVGAGITAALRYQPIEWQDGPTGPAVTHADGTRADGVVKDGPAVDAEGSPIPTVTSTEPGSTVSVPSLIGDHGRFSVDVLGFASPFGARAVVVKVLMGDAHGSPADRSFRRFTLRPGDLRSLTIVLRPRYCPGPGHNDVAVATGQNLTYRFPGVTHHALVTIHGTGYGITGIGSCWRRGPGEPLRNRSDVERGLDEPVAVGDRADRRGPADDQR